MLALARLLELLADRPLAVGVDVGVLDLLRQFGRVAVPDPAGSRLDLLVDHLRQAPELPPDRLGLTDEHLEHVVLHPLREHEVVAADLGGRLQLAVDPPVALLDSPGVPRQVEVEQIGAVRLEVQTLPRRIGRDQDPHRLLGRIGVESPLDLVT